MFAICIATFTLCSPRPWEAPSCPKRSATLKDFGDFCLYGIQIFQRLSRFPWRTVGRKGYAIPEALGHTAILACCLPRMPVRSPSTRHVPMGVPHISHVLIKIWHVFKLCLDFPRMKRGHRVALKHVCAHGIKKKASQAIAIIVSWDQSVVSDRSRTATRLSPPGS